MSIIYKILKYLENVELNSMEENELITKIKSNSKLSEIEAKNIIKLMINAGYIQNRGSSIVGSPHQEIIFLQPKGIDFIMEYSYKQGQTKILKEMNKIYWILAFATIIMAVATFILAIKK